jgi:glyoxylase-like metal-dependent hydrolase (beta-lactamase superfamily II)
LLVDSGLDRQAGRQILRCLEAEGLVPKVIVNTHSHADHYGGNAVIRQQSAAQVFASPLEKAVIENPYLEPFYLFSAAPVQELATRFLMAQPSPVDGVLQAGRFNCHGFEVEIIALPGHSPQQVGVVTGDDVCFTADAYFGEDILAKYGMPYTADVSAALDTLRVLWQSRYQLYVPSHGLPSEKPVETILKNVAAIEQALEQILAILREAPRTREEVLAAVITKNGRSLDAIQYVLNHGTVTACLSHLYKIGKVGFTFHAGKMLWSAAAGRPVCFTGG